MNDLQQTERQTAQVAGSNVEFLASLGDLPRTIWRHKWYVLASLAVTLALGVVYLVVATPVYIAQARAVVERKDLPLQDHPLHGGPEFFATQVEVVRSPEVLRGAMRSVGLPKPPGETPETFAKVLHRVLHAVMQYLSPTPEVDPEVACMTNMLQQLTVNPVLGSNVLNIGYRDPDPDQAARVLIAVINSYTEYSQKLEQDAHAETLKLLKLSEQQLQEDAGKLEAEYQKQHEKSPLLGQGKDASSVQHDFLLHLGQKLTDCKSRRIDLENQLQALAARQGKQLALPAAAEGRNSPEQAKPQVQSDRPRIFYPAIHRVLENDGGLAEPGIVDDVPRGDLSKIQDELWRAQVKAKELDQNYGPKHPNVLAVKDQISLWQKVLRETIDANSAGLEQELTAVKLNESHLTQLRDSEFKETKALDAYIHDEQRIAEELHRVQAMHETTLTKLRQWELDDQVLVAGKGGVTVQVIDDPANAIPRKLWPRTILVLAACLAFGFLGGAGLASIVDYRARTSPVS